MEDKLPSVFSITPTCGRFKCIRRALSLFLDQDYEGKHTMLIFNNSDHPYTLDIPLSYNKDIILINSPVNSKTGNKYTSLGEIHNDALNFVPEEVDIIIHSDDDDLVLPNHISEGVKGFIRGQKLAYKPERSWFMHPGGVELMGNNMEPSVFIDAKFLKSMGYEDGVNVTHHLSWLGELQRTHQIFIDPEGKPTLIYTWGIIEDNVFKTSGAGETSTNFANYRRFSQDFGNGALTPLPKEQYTYLLRIPK